MNISEEKNQSNNVIKDNSEQNNSMFFGIVSSIKLFKDN